MFEKTGTKEGDKQETIQEIAIKLVAEQLRLLQSENGPKESTVFLLGSKGVGKSTVINKFFEREENSLPTLALEYSYGRRTGSTVQQVQKQVLNVWELGSLDNADQLIEVPLRRHGVENFSAIIMLDLSQPHRVWLELECAYNGLKDTCTKMMNASQWQLSHENATKRLKKEHKEIANLELLPFPVVIVGGKYDLFLDFDSEIKKHICHCLRSMSHLIGGSVLFYSNKIPKSAKTLRDTLSHLGFGSPTNPFRSYIYDYNDALSIWFGMDSWERIGIINATNVERIGTTLSLEVPQLQIQLSAKEKVSLVDPGKDVGFYESVINEMRAQNDDELQAVIKESQLRGKFESVIGGRK